MSHVRKLFQEPPPNEPDSFPAPVEVLPVAVQADSDRPRFPVVQAELRPAGRIVAHTDSRSHGADRFRFLRMRLRELAGSGRLKSLLVTSVLPGDGKSTVVLNLATALCERGQHPVLVVEADLHHGSMARTLGLPAWDGLAECLESGVDPFAAVRRVEPLGWYLLPAGKAHRNPTELLQSPELPAVFEKLSAHFEWILIDSPPAIPLTDSLSLQHHADATLLAVKAGATPKALVEQALDLLGRNHVLGIVLNGVQGLDRLYYKYRSYRGKDAAAANA